jgi:hypothetical protein
LREREGLIARIRQIRRVAPAPEETDTSWPLRSGQDEMTALAARVSHLEQLLQGLQDSVHRDSLRYGKRIADLEAATQPEALGKTLSEHAREHGL